MSRTIKDESLRLNIVVNGNEAKKELGEMQSQTSELINTNKELRQEKSLLNKEDKDYKENLKKINHTMKQNNAEISQNEARMKGLRQEIGINGLTTRQLRQEYGRLKRSMDNLTPGTAEWNKANAQMQKYKARLDQVSAGAKKTGSSIGRMADKFNRFMGIGAAAIATIMGIVYAIKEWSDGLLKLDDSLANIMKTTGLSLKEVRELNSEFKYLNTRTPRSELRLLAEQAGRLGKTSKKDILEFVEVANQIKVALGDDLGGEAEVAIREVGKLTNIYKIGQKYGTSFKDSMLKMGSAINEVSANSQAQAPYLIEMLKRLGGIADKADISAQNVIGYGSALDQLGQRQEMSATAISKVILSMFSDVETFAGIAQVSYSDFLNLLQTDANEAFLTFLDGLNGNNEGLIVMSKKLDDLGIDGSRATQVLASLASNTKLIREQQDLANSSLEEGISLTKEYNIRNNNLAGNMEKIQRAIYAAFINSNINAALEGIVSKIVKWVEIPLSDKLVSERREVNRLVIEMTDINTAAERRNTIYERLKEINPDIVAGINAENIELERLNTNIERYNSNQIDRIILAKKDEEIMNKKEKRDSLADDLAERKITVTDKIIKGINALRKADEEAYKQAVEIQNNTELDVYSKAVKIERLTNEHDVTVDMTNALYYYMEAVQDLATSEVQLNDITAERIELMELLGIESDKITGKKTPDAPSATMGPMPYDYSAFNKPLSKEETAALKAKIKAQEAAAKKLKQLEEDQLAFRQKVLIASKSLIAQEEAAYQQRLNNAGIFTSKRKDLEGDMLETFDVLLKQHKDNNKKIADQVFAEQITKEEQNFQKISNIKETEFLEELKSLGKNEKAKKELTDEYQKDEIIRTRQFLDLLLSEYQAALDDEGIASLENAILSEDGKNALKLRMEELRLALAELGIELDALTGSNSSSDIDVGGAGNVDVLGTTFQGWIDIMGQFKLAVQDGKVQLEDMAAIGQAFGAVASSAMNLWNDFARIRMNQEKQDFIQYSQNIDKRKSMLAKRLDDDLISQEKYNDQIAMLDNQVTERKRAIQNEEAKNAKTNAIFQAIINTALGITSALTVQPTWLGIALAAVVGLLGGVQIAKISSEPTPQYAKGKYDVIGQDDGRRYRANKIRDPKTGLITTPTILVGEKPEIIIDPATTRNLQMNYPGVIDAINMARVPQFASGSYNGSVKEVHSEKSIPPEFYDLMLCMQDELKRSNDIREKGIPAKLVADSEYVDTHNEVMQDYQSLQQVVNIG